MKWLISIVLFLFFSCENPKNQENTQIPITQTDTIKQTPETTEKLSGKQLLDSLLKKAKYRDLKKIELPENLINFDTPQKHKINKQEFSTLSLEDFKYDVYTSNLYVYGYFGKFRNNYLFAILRQEAIGNIADLWLVDSLGKCKAIQKNIVRNWGDMGFIWQSHTEKTNDSSFIIHSKEFDHRNNPKQIILSTQTHFFIQKDSFFIKKVDTLVYKKPKYSR
jgi:hypothetical protein